MDCFADNSRHVVGDFNEVYYDPNDFIDLHLNNIKIFLKNIQVMFHFGINNLNMLKCGRKRCYGRQFSINFTREKMLK